MTRINMAEEFEKEVEEQVGKRLDPEKCEEIEKKIKSLMNEEVPMDKAKDFVEETLIAQGYNEQDVVDCVEEMFDRIFAKQKLDQIKKIVNSLKL